MEVNKNTAELISEIEFIIGSECYNPNSYDGYSGEEGRDFRYPVTISKKNAEGKIIELKVRRKILEDFQYKYYDFEPNDIRRSKYKFGSNHLYICLGIQKALAFLEKKYNLDFEELEKRYMEEHPNEQP